MKSIMTAVAIATAIAFPLSAFADTNGPFGDNGAPNPSTVLYANASGEVIGTFIGQSGQGTDLVRLFNETTGITYNYMAPNNAAAVGSQYDFGYANAGDVLSFQIDSSVLDDPNGYYIQSGETPNPVMSSDANLSFDGYSHTRVLAQADGSLGLYFEDVPFVIDPHYPGKYFTDGDYNDDAFSFTTINAAQTPEPESLALLGTGLLGMFTIAKRRFSK